MNILVLGAGYATRLYPLTLNQPKPLLPVAGKPMMEHVLDKLKTIPGVDRIYVVTNEKFTPHFEKWAGDYQKNHPELSAKIVNDHSTDDSNKLGAIGDIHLVLNRENIQSDLIIIAGDNLFSEPLENFGRYCLQKKTPVIGVYDVGSLEDIKKFGCIAVDENSKIVDFEEKPKEPKSTLASVALYYYPAESLRFIKQYIAEGNNPDQPGRLVQWLYSRTAVHAWKVPGIWYDIGSKEALEEANQTFKK